MTYEVVTHSRAGFDRSYRYASNEPLEPGALLRLAGRFWVVVRVEESPDAARAWARTARYRLRLVHPDGREEPGGVRRYHPDAPGLGHAFTTVEDGRPASWEVVDRELAFDEEGEPFLDLVARRDFVEPEELPDHELEHALADEGGAERTLARLDGTDLSLELVALEPGQAPDWVDAQSYLDALTFDEIEDDLFEQCGVDTRQDPRETWLETVKERLRGDLASFRADVEGGHDQVEEWDYLDGRVFAGVGSYEEEADPDSGYGWLCRLLDAGVLAAAGFRRVRKSELQVAD